MLNRKENIIIEKTERFADRIVDMCNFIKSNRKANKDMINQILRSGTSIGANLHEALYAQSKADFASKLNISLKEASETSYWLVLLHKTDFLNSSIYESLKTDIDEIIKMIIASLKTIRKDD